MRSVLAPLLILLLVAAPALSYLFFSLQKQQLKRSLKHELIARTDKSELSRIAIHITDLSQLKWEHSKEFEFKGWMYDVVEKELKYDSIIFWCWWDYEETELNKRLQESLIVLLQQNQQRKQKELQLEQYFKTLYFSENSFSYSFNKGYLIFPLFNEIPISGFLEPVSPPPKVCL